jgi:hypothetical protein
MSPCYRSSQDGLGWAESMTSCKISVQLLSLIFDLPNTNHCPALFKTKKASTWSFSWECQHYERWGTCARGEHQKLTRQVQKVDARHKSPLENPRYWGYRVPSTLHRGHHHRACFWCLEFSTADCPASAFWQISDFHFITSPKHVPSLLSEHHLLCKRHVFTKSRVGKHSADHTVI